MKDYGGYLGDMAPETATGRHMIGGLEMLAEHNANMKRIAEAEGDEVRAAEWGAWVEVLETAWRCILNEAARADRAEKMLRAHNAHSGETESGT